MLFGVISLLLPELFEAPGTTMLLLGNVLVSGYALFFNASLIDRLGIRPVRIREQGEWYRFITAGFVHAGLLHLGFNLLILYFCGFLTETILGTGNLIMLYFGSMLVADAWMYWGHRKDEAYNAVGASGGIGGVAMAFFLFHPTETISLFFFIPTPVWLIAVVFVGGAVYAMIKARKSGRKGGTAHDANLGGALGGVVLTILLEPRALQVFLSHFGF